MGLSRVVFPILALTAGILCAQNTVSSPQGGFLYDPPTESLYPVLGSVGSSSLGPAVLTEISFGSVDPSQDRAIACDDRTCFLATDLKSGTAVRTTLPPLPSRPEGAAWSTDGSTVVLYSPSLGWIRSVGNLSSTPALTLQFDLPAGIGPLTSVAAGDQGRTVIALGGGQGGIFELTNAASLARIADGSGFTSLAFDSAGQVFYALDTGSREVAEIQLTSHVTRRMAAPLDDPAAVRPWRNADKKQVLYVIGSADQALVVLDPASGTLKERFDLAFQPRQLESVSDQILLLNSRRSTNDLLWTFIPGRGTFFIPDPPPVKTALPRRRQP